jgi:hypothetical protein
MLPSEGRQRRIYLKKTLKTIKEKKRYHAPMDEV